MNNNSQSQPDSVFKHGDTFVIEGIIRMVKEHGFIVEKRIIVVNGHELDLATSLKVVYHSPGGFHWGYGGSGPAQAAFAVLQNLYGNEIAQQYYQALKREVIARQNIDHGFKITVKILTCKIEPGPNGPVVIPVNPGQDQLFWVVESNQSP